MDNFCKNPNEKNINNVLMFLPTNSFEIKSAVDSQAYFLSNGL